VVENNGLSITKQAISYAWRQLAQRAGVNIQSLEGTGFESLGISTYYAHPDEIVQTKPSIIVIPCNKASEWGLLRRQPNSLHKIDLRKVLPNGSSYSNKNSIPVLFWGSGCKVGKTPFVRIDNGSIIFYADIIAATLFCLTRWEETVATERDEHGRFPAKESVAFKQNFLDRPIIDEYGLILREWLKALLGKWEPKQQKFEVRISHDIDSMQHFASLWGGIRTFGGDILKRNDISLARWTISELLSQIFSQQNTSNMQRVYLLSEISKQLGLRNAFYVMSSKPGPVDNDYDIDEPHIRRCISWLQEQGFEIGLHPSYYTYNDLERLSEEKQRMDRILGYSEYGGRQHFLRFSPDTWRYWDQLGFSYDSTVGYPEHEGFRCGTCHPFHPFDLNQNVQIDLLEIPLIVMDATLRRHRNLSTEEGEKVIHNMVERCQSVDGTFTMLWHNTGHLSVWKPWLEVYKRTIRHVTGLSE